MIDRIWQWWASKYREYLPPERSEREAEIDRHIAERERQLEEYRTAVITRNLNLVRMQARGDKQRDDY